MICNKPTEITSRLTLTLAISPLFMLLCLTACKKQAEAGTNLKPTATGATLTEVSGGKQIGAAGALLKDSVVLQVNDDQGSPLAGALVQLHGPAAVTFNPVEALTDTSGQITSAVTLGTDAGRFSIQAITPGKAHPISISITQTALDYQQRLGATLADNYCVRCHDPESSAERVSNYDNLAVKPHLLSDGATLNKMSDADLTAILEHGGPGLNRSALMPAYGNTLSASDIKALIAYMRAISDPPFQPSGIVYAHR